MSGEENGIVLEWPERHRVGRIKSYHFQNRTFGDFSVFLKSN
jgi:hypothetical protein